MAQSMYQKPKGTLDLLPGESHKWHYVEEIARLLFENYQYKEIRTPIFENFEVFSRTSGDTSDVVTKEMYDFNDKGKRHLALRPEGTAGVVRSFVENKLFGPEYQKPYKSFYIGPMFRYERPQAGRMRQFHQIGVEAFGSDDPALDAEMIAMVVDFFQTLGLSNLKVVVNTLGDLESRKVYRKALIEYLNPYFNELSYDSQIRLEKNPFRVLDSKDSKDQEIVSNAPSILDYLSLAAKERWDKFKVLLESVGIEYEIDTNVVRGLDYYNHTIFEVMAQSEALGHGWTTIAGGGRYNGLVEELGGPEVSGIGFGIGFERLMILLESEKVKLPELPVLDLYVANQGEDTDLVALQLVQVARSFGYSVDRDYLGRKLKSQFKAADRQKARYIVVIGEHELETQSVNLKNMKSGKEFNLKLTELYTNLPCYIDENDINMEEK